MNIEILNLFPVMIVVSNEREHEFEQERENESSKNAKESRTCWRDDQRKELYQPPREHFRNNKCYAESHSRLLSRS